MLWLVSTTCATSAWALSDICCDACIEECADEPPPLPRKERRQFLQVVSDEAPPSPVRSRGRPTSLDDFVMCPRANPTSFADGSCHGDSIASRLCRGRAKSTGNEASHTRHLLASPSRPVTKIAAKPAGAEKHLPSARPPAVATLPSSPCVTPPTTECHQGPGLIGRISSEQNAIVRCPR